jgi:hypothetical protein
MRPVVAYELDGDLAFVLDTALEEFAARIREDPNHAPQWTDRMAGLADEARRRAIEAFERPEPARPAGVASSYQDIDVIFAPDGCSVEVGHKGADVVLQVFAGSDGVALSTEKREQFQRAFMEAERYAEAHAKDAAAPRRG